MKYGITDIEDAILAVLAPLKTAFKLREVKPYAGELDPDKFKELKAWPFILVTYNGCADVTDSGSRKVEHLRWIVFVGDRDPDLAKARRGGTGPGTNAMLEAVREILEGKEILGLFATQRLGDEALLNEASMSVYAAHYEIKQGYMA